MFQNTGSSISFGDEGTIGNDKAQKFVSEPLNTRDSLDVQLRTILFQVHFVTYVYLGVDQSNRTFRKTPPLVRIIHSILYT